MRSRQNILMVILVFVAASVIGIATATYYKLPAGLDCPTCTEDTVLQDSFAHGTAITAPVVILVAFLVFGLLVLQRSWIGFIGNLGVVLIVGVFFVASALDVATREVLREAASLNGEYLLPALVYLTCAGLIILIFVLNAKDIRSRFQMRFEEPLPSHLFQ